MTQNRLSFVSTEILFPVTPRRPIGGVGNIATREQFYATPIVKMRERSNASLLLLTRLDENRRHGQLNKLVSKHKWI